MFPDSRIWRRGCCRPSSTFRPPPKPLLARQGRIAADGNLPPGSPFEQFFKDFYDQYQNGRPPAEEKISSLGSGFVIDAANGYIVTNNHVIKDADEIKVILSDNTSLDAKLVGADAKPTSPYSR